MTRTTLVRFTALSLITFVPPVLIAWVFSRSFWAAPLPFDGALALFLSVFSPMFMCGGMLILDSILPAKR